MSVFGAAVRKWTVLCIAVVAIVSVSVRLTPADPPTLVTPWSAGFQFGMAADCGDICRGA